MATRMKMDLLTAVEQIVEMAKDSQLSKEFFRKADILNMCQPNLNSLRNKV